MESIKDKTILIDETKCNGCGLCVSACHEGVIALIDGKARVVKEDFCDGLGSCIPQCPQNAISLVERKNNFCPYTFSKGTNHWPIQLALLSPRFTLFKRTSYCRRLYCLCSSSFPGSFERKESHHFLSQT
ncbi:MAG: ATP-binding protein [Candidatus Caldatribacteriaceae bacterium]